MSHFSIVNESTEDTLECTDDIQEAIRMAQEVARQGQAGDPVSILERGGKAVMQFVLMPDGTVAEQAIARQIKRSEPDAEQNGAEEGAAPNRGGLPPSPGSTASQPPRQVS